MRNNRINTPNLLLIVSSVLVLAACTGVKTHYRYRNPFPQVAEEKESDKYVIVHIGSEAYHITEMSYDSKTATVKGKLTEPNSTQLQLHKKHEGQWKFRAKKIERSLLRNQLHIFLNSIAMTPSTDTTYYNCEISDTSFLWVQYYTTSQRTAVITSVAVVGGIGVFLIVACNCPSVYTYVNDTTEYNGGLFPGALSPNMSRRDILPVTNYLDEDRHLNLQIKNRTDEHQYIDRMNLLRVEHTAGSEVIFDNAFNAYEVNSTIAPVSATSENGTDHLNELLEKDDAAYEFSEALDDDNFNDLTLTFRNADQKDKATLILNAGNTSWSVWMYDQFTAIQGNRYDVYAKRSAATSPEKKTERLREQGMIMSVYLKKNGSWEFVDYVNIAGTVNRNIAIPLDLSSFAPGENIEVKLRAGFRLWNVDFAGIDYNCIPANVQIIEPAAAIQSNGTNVLTSLSTIDYNYAEHSANEDYTRITFEVPTVAESKTQSLFIDGYGYYTKSYQSTASADKKQVRAFRFEGAYSAWSQQHYCEMKVISDLFVKQ